MDSRDQLARADHAGRFHEIAHAHGPQAIGGVHVALPYRRLGQRGRRVYDDVRTMPGDRGEQLFAIVEIRP